MKIELSDDERLLIVEALNRRGTAIFRCRTPSVADRLRCEELISKITHPGDYYANATNRAGDSAVLPPVEVDR